MIAPALQYTDYEITTETTKQVYKIRRRFSDFDWLRAVIKWSPNNFAPKRLWWGNFDPKFIENRRAALEAFLRLLTKTIRLSAPENPKNH